MEHAGSEEMGEEVERKGLGTPATRAAIIEKLVEKVDKAVKAIHKMLEDGEKVTIPKLMSKTGLSRGSFYKNLVVWKEVDRALEQQAGMVDSKCYIGNMTLKYRIELLE